MRFKLPGLKRDKRAAPTLTAIFIAPTAGEPMRSVAAAEALANRGLLGDRYSDDAGHWKSIDGCQVTLITEHDLEQAKKGADPGVRQTLDNGGHRRNLVVAGIKIKNLEGKDFRIGTVVFRYAKPRPPCAYLDQVSGSGMARALGHHGGVCLRVVSGGELSVGQAVVILDPD